MNTQNFLTARALRRRIIKELREQQALDSSCSEKLRDSISRHTKAILGIVSGLLMSFDSNRVSGEDKAVFTRVAPSCITVEDWLKARKEEVDAATELTILSTYVKSAEAAYDRVAPFGFVSGWFAKSDEERRISAARSERDHLRVQHASAEQKHRAAIQAVQNLADAFLRNAMSPEGLRILSSESPVQKELQTALTILTSELTEIWTAHTDKQMASLESIRTATADLFSVYERQNLAESTPLLKGRYAAIAD